MKPRKKQEDRLLKQLPYGEQVQQRKLRSLIAKDLAYLVG